MQVVIAEKPSVAADIARVVGATKKEAGYFAGEAYCVTWLYGHLLEIEPKGDPGWDLAKLPFIPEGFTLKPIAEAVKRDGKTVMSDSGTIERLRTIKSLVDRSTGVVIATDAGREGELIARNILSFIRCNVPCLRLWISSLTEEAIRKGFENLYPSGQFDSLAAAAKQRTVADWLVGVNATRALTLKSQPGSSGHGTVLSLGRVQSAVLKMLCERYIEYKNFEKKPYWYLVGESSVDGATFKWRGNVHYDKKYLAQKDRDAVLDYRYIDVQSVTTRRVQEEAPLLHNIDSLQKMANSRYGYTLQETLSAVQNLYEKKYCTYPRTDSRYIPEDVYRTVPHLLSTVVGNKSYGDIAKLLYDHTDLLSRRCVNDQKLTDHHALLITKNPLPEDNDLPEMENRVYELILMRFLEAFAPDCIVDVTDVKLVGGGNVEFNVRGRRIVRTGWKLVNRDAGASDVEIEDADQQELGMGPLPRLTEGMSLPIGRLDLKEDVTKPTPLYTDATILTAMENAGRQTDDKTLAEAIAQVGIGTAATRSGILELLVKRKYIERAKNRKLSPTDLGLKVYNVIKDMNISSVALTASWEMQLNDIANGRMDPKEFSKKVRQYAMKTTREILDGKEGMQDLTDYVKALKIKCPKCGSEVILYGHSAKCINDKCGFFVPRAWCGKTLTDESLRALVKTGRTGILKGFTGKKGPFDAALEMDREGHVTFIFDKTKSKK